MTELIIASLNIHLLALNMDITLKGQYIAGGLLVGFTRLQMDISSQ
ncbi:MAG: hypothetical protein ACOX0Y_04840 [Thiopseudomonas sp.]